MKKYWIMGNWKANGTLEALSSYALSFARSQDAGIFHLDDQTEVALALPYHLLGRGIDTGPIVLGAENVCRFDEGAYTGEITAGMLTELGCAFSLVGHSERRGLFGETVEDTSGKIARLVEKGVLPVLCIGETLDQRRQGLWQDVLRFQMEPVDLLPADASIIIAYEPVWAIGTGVAAQPADVRQAHTLVKSILTAMGRPRTPVLYGGSVKPENAAELGAIGEVNGFLIGGASLKPAPFIDILSAFILAKQ